MSSREERMAKNEATSREINDQVEEAHQLDPPGRRFQISCECALNICGRVITITVDEYRHVRMDPRQFAIVPEHFIGDIDRIVYRTTVSPWLRSVREFRQTWRGTRTREGKEDTRSGGRTGVSLESSDASP